MLALGSPLFFVDVFLFDSPLLLSMLCSKLSPEKAQGQPDQKLFRRNAILKLLCLQFCFCQDEVQTEMYNTI